MTSTTASILKNVVHVTGANAEISKTLGSLDLLHGSFNTDIASYILGKPAAPKKD
jgi:hypothetical protein